MDNKTNKFIVPVLYKGCVVYSVEATDETAAMDEARAAFERGEPGSGLGTEWETIDRFGTIKIM
jgi:hypothetical protein